MVCPYLLLLHHVAFSMLCNTTTWLPMKIKFQSPIKCLILLAYMLVCCSVSKTKIGRALFFLCPWSMLWKKYPSHAALNEALREEVQRLKIAAGQAPNMNGNPFNGGLQQQIPPYYTQQQQQQQQQMPYLGGHHAQQRHPSHQQSSSNGGQSLSGQSLNDSMDFMWGEETRGPY